CARDNSGTYHSNFDYW
nr:immunoglobulin heavy chain junction region [Macaca mulatta]MPN69756.1 immunoglobulin heavy chain junction region [Macaca mulatta]MPN71938.1 immunoglobulin heavy chain junction region [Macaca mulatta]MPN72387.1 immunoglobulin heavy chain junction region [Macaca mulatta]MPN72708.1 immunoglobulin heavy chain junction region [Macaca mulatta]